ncbi:FAD-dependent monooxygenase [Marivita sp. S6314]|uniref:NAD(P)/FAD-dependent oxidoreductase n=1 Tax=Marivita sp. S6314 TaxID=2926406 RepID=UPI001FF30969|nr:NAD(P)/FAD-dependent oxidoreductase [Marivita sp. S6314]MCK0150518.1 FAD-dependent monooxygenase [Marivita sp. S6314]
MFRMQIAVIGGGPAGCACAIELGRSGMPVCLIDAGQTGPKPGEVLAPSAQGDLEALGVSADHLSETHLVCTGIDRVWGGADVARVDYATQLTHGWHLDRTAFDAALQDLCRSVGVDVVTGTALRNLRQTTDGWRLDLDNGTERAATFLVDASGRRAVVASQLGIKGQVQDRLVAFHAVVPNGESRAAQPMFIEAVENGWWYTTPVPGGKRVFAFLTDSDLPAAHHAAQADGFRALLEKTRIVAGFDASHEPLTPKAYAATSRRLDAFRGAHWLAIGDAAIGRDPLSGGGIAQGLEDGRTAAAALKWAQRTGDAEFASFEAHMQSVWDTHERERRAMYMTETRWTWSPFWARRSGDASVAQER